MSRFQIRKRLATLLSGIHQKKEDDKAECSTTKPPSDSEVMSQIVENDFDFKMAIASTNAKWSALESLYIDGTITRSEFVQKESHDPDEFAYIANFYGKNGEILETAEATPIGTWSNGNKSFLWAWLNPQFKEWHPESMAWLRRTAINGIEKFGLNLPGIVEIFETDDEIEVDWGDQKAQENYNQMQFIAIDQIQADGRDWKKHSDIGETLFAYYLNQDSFIKPNIEKYKNLVEYWTRQLFQHKLSLIVRGDLGTNLSRESQAIQVVMDLFRSILDNPEGANSDETPEAEKRNWLMVTTFIRMVKESTILRSSIAVHIKEPYEDDVLKEFLGNIGGIVDVLRQRTGTLKPHDDDERIITGLMCEVIKYRLEDIEKYQG